MGLAPLTVLGRLWIVYRKTGLLGTSTVFDVEEPPGANVTKLFTVISYELL